LAWAVASASIAGVIVGVLVVGYDSTLARTGRAAPTAAADDALAGLGGRVERDAPDRGAGLVVDLLLAGRVAAPRRHEEAAVGVEPVLELLVGVDVCVFASRKSSARLNSSAW
jgi:hypothetical protein